MDMQDEQDMVHYLSHSTTTGERCNTILYILLIHV